MDEALIRLLHLSDLAFSEGDRWRQDPIRDGLVALVATLSPDAVVITGDIAASGAAAELDLAERWIVDALLPAAKLPIERVFVVPGERDIAPIKTDGRALYERLVQGGQPTIAEVLDDPEQNPPFLRRFAGFLAFANRLRGGRPPLDTPWWSETLTLRGRTIGLAGLCSAWAAGARASDQGSLLVGKIQLNAVLPPGMDRAARVVLCHHPLGWLNDIDVEVPQLLAARAALLLRGHDAAPAAGVEIRHQHPLAEVCAGVDRAALVELWPQEVRRAAYRHTPRGWTIDRNDADPGLDHKRLRLAAPTPPPQRSPGLRPPPAPRPWPPEPYPLLASYEHPDTFGGRGAELAKLLDLLQEERLILTLFAPSGAGKSSLLRAGLLPALWGHTGRSPCPVALDELPAVPGLAQRLLQKLTTAPLAEHGPGALLGGSLAQHSTAPPGELDPADFAARLAALRDEAGQRPVLVLDQLEDVFDTPAPGWLGPLLSATMVAPGGRAARWVLVYRHEFHGRVEHWLGDVLRYAPPGLALPRDLLRPEVRQSWCLPLLGEGGDALAAFEEAIRKPLDLRDPDGSPHYRRSMSGSDITRLARAFAEARQRAPEDPLTPELQVVMHRLGPGVMRVPEDPHALMQDAIGAHLLDGLRAVAARAAQPREVSIRLTQALLVLGALVDPEGRRCPQPEHEFMAGLEPGAQALARELARPGVWLIRNEDRHGVPWTTLFHDRVAREVRRLLDSPEEQVRFGLDAEGVGLWRLAEQRAASWASGDAGAVELEPRVFAALEERQDSLPRSERARAWWEAARRARRARDRAEALLRVRAAHPRSGEPLRALHRLLRHHGPGDAAEALRVIPGRPDALDAERREEIFGLGPSGLSEAERGEILAELVIALAPGCAASAQRESQWGGLLAAAEVVAFTDPGAAEAARAAVVAAIKAERGEPPPLDPGGWSPVIAGRFEVGCFREVEDAGQADEALHAVILPPYRIRRFAERLEDYWLFAPEHRRKNPYDGRLPALNVNWYEATAYAAWRGAALPTEAQWEVAARGGRADDYRRTAYFNGNGAESLEQVGLYSGNAERVFARIGGQRPLYVDDAATLEALWPGAAAHPLGLVHIHGNVYTWCRDWYAPYPGGVVEAPAGPPVPPDPAAAWRVLRGGSWVVSAVVARAAYRRRDLPSYRSVVVGVRLVILQPLEGGS